MRIAVFLFVVSTLTSHAAGRVAVDQWIPIFNSQTLDGWKANENPGSWTIKDGSIRGDGPVSHLFYMNEKCQNCEFKAEVRINHGGNSGMFFRTAFGPGFPKGYEAQIDNTHTDPIRTGSLYGFVKVFEQLIPDDTWWTQHVIVEGNHIQIFVNDRKTVDYVDEKNTYTDGYLALQQHNAGSVVEFKNVMMKVLPGPSSPLVGRWRLNREKSKVNKGELFAQLEVRILEERDGLRYQEDGVATDGQKDSVNFYFRPDGYNYRVTGSPNYDHISIDLLSRHLVHLALRKSKLRKKEDPYSFVVEETKQGENVGKASYTISPDRKTLTREGSLKLASGEEVAYTEVFDNLD